MALQPWRKGIVTDILDETPTTRRFRISVPELSSFDFIPGQFITLDLPIHEKVNKRWRSYSIASDPDGTNTIELVISLNVNGLGTPWLFNEVKAGQELTFRGPQGVYKLEQPVEKPLFMICTGTGIAPFRSMLRHIQRNRIPHKNVHLIFGCRKKTDLLYDGEMRSLEKEMEGFCYIPVLSRENWEGRTGYVHAVYEELCRERPAAGFYLCGWKAMLDEAKQRIAAMGYTKADMHLESYG
jgi:CDP-4-dehydro-6-deoxyglucose reductase